MKRKELLLYWVPRLLAISYILFLGIFALDAFTPASSLGEQLVAVSMHLLPNVLLLLFLIYAWRNELNGGVVFILVGLIFTLVVQTYEEWSSLIIIARPLFLIGISFLTNIYIHSQESI
jgi:hypothetical protein